MGLATYWPPKLVASASAEHLGQPIAVRTRAPYLVVASPNPLHFAFSAVPPSPPPAPPPPLVNCTLPLFRKKSIACNVLSINQFKRLLACSLAVFILSTHLDKTTYHIHKTHIRFYHPTTSMLQRIPLLLVTAASAPALVSALFYGGYNYQSIGCFSSTDGLAEVSSSATTSGNCVSSVCKGYSVFATSQNACYCGNSLPSKSDLANGKCTSPCLGYPGEMCGGDGGSVFNFYVVDNTPAYSSYLAGQLGSAGSSSATASSPAASAATSSSPSAASSSPASSSSPSATSHASSSPLSSSPSSSTSSASPSPSASGSPNKSSKKSISGGAIAGIVIGVIAALVIVALVFIFLRRRRAHLDYAASSTPNGFKEPFGVKSSPYPPMPPSPFAAPPPLTSSGQVDQRLNPSMLGERRISVGSLADARDYSRKILRVTNPDDA